MWVRPSKKGGRNTEERHHGQLGAGDWEFRARDCIGGRRPVVDDDKRAAILARRERGESIRTIAIGVGVSVGVVHKTLTEAKTAL
ncbi:hypothetical protein GCM10017559_45040 [Streptosporangium longisporum]|uniref:Helix-turn-helix domain-containing protein n=1 Tax=Streptosporangium longisporum TaxID=46187 RepID=A0ABN3Y3U9_9ACTN